MSYSISLISCVQIHLYSFIFYPHNPYKSIHSSASPMQTNPIILCPPYSFIATKQFQCLAIDCHLFNTTVLGKYSSGSKQEKESCYRDIPLWMQYGASLFGLLFFGFASGCLPSRSGFVSSLHAMCFVWEGVKIGAVWWIYSSLWVNRIGFSIIKARRMLHP